MLSFHFHHRLPIFIHRPREIVDRGLFAQRFLCVSVELSDEAGMGHFKLVGIRGPPLVFEVQRALVCPGDDGGVEARLPSLGVS